MKDVAIYFFNRLNESTLIKDLKSDGKDVYLTSKFLAIVRVA